MALGILLFRIPSCCLHPPPSYFVDLNPSVQSQHKSPISHPLPPPDPRPGVVGPSWHSISIAMIASPLQSSTPSWPGLWLQVPPQTGLLFKVRDLRLIWISPKVTKIEKCFGIKKTHVLGFPWSEKSIQKSPNLNILPCPPRILSLTFSGLSGAQW